MRPWHWKSTHWRAMSRLATEILERAHELFQPRNMSVEKVVLLPADFDMDEVMGWVSVREAQRLMSTEGY